MSIAGLSRQCQSRLVVYSAITRNDGNYGHHGLRADGSHGQHGHRCCSSNAHMDDIKSRPYAYYEVLGLSKSARVTDIKAAFYRLAKMHHPDKISSLPEEERQKSKLKFEQITEAYTTLMDVTQRHFYDQHGFSCEGLKKQGLPSIFDYKPRFDLYDTPQHADGETTALEDWFKAQGHSVHEPKITLRQRAINAYVELRWGLKYYDFPWKLKELFGACCIWGIGFIMFYLGLRQYLRDKMEALPDGDALKPQKIYLMWENDEIRDILHYYGIRKNKPSSQSRGGFYHMPKVEKKQKSEYTHTIYSNTRSGRLSKNKNREDHKKRLEDQKAKRLERINKLKQREYVEPSQKKEEAKEQLTVVSS